MSLGESEPPWNHTIFHRALIIIDIVSLTDRQGTVAIKVMADSHQPMLAMSPRRLHSLRFDPSPPLTRPWGHRMWRAHRKPATMALKAFACGSQKRSQTSPLFLPAQKNAKPYSLGRVSIRVKGSGLPRKSHVLLGCHHILGSSEAREVRTVRRLPKASTEESSASSSFRLSTLEGQLDDYNLLSYRPRQLSSLEPPIAPLGLDVYDSER